MKTKDNNSESGLPEFLSYSGGEMTDKERNAFERKLQKDPFAEEAAEGFAGLTSTEAEHDVARLQQKLRTRVNRKQRLVFYRIAASIAVLMILSSVWLVIRHSRPSDIIGEMAIAPVTLDINKSDAIQAAKSAEPNQTGPSENKKQEIRAEKQDETVITARNEDQTGIAAGEAKRDHVVQEINVKDAEILSTQRKLEIPSAMAKSALPTREIRGRIISAEDQQPLPGATVVVKGTNEGTITDAAGNFNITLPDNKKKTLLATYIGMEAKEFMADTMKNLLVTLEPSSMALSEVVVVGYGAKKAAEAQEDEAAISGYKSPEPADGQKNFDLYVEKNIRRPASMTEGQRFVVVLSFTVRTSGTIDSVKVVRSPGEEFSREAVRLIKEGPSWKPASQDGEVIQDDVRVRIVFK